MPAGLFFIDLTESYWFDLVADCPLFRGTITRWPEGSTLQSTKQIIMIIPLGHDAPTSPRFRLSDAQDQGSVTCVLCFMPSLPV